MDTEERTRMVKIRVRERLRRQARRSIYRLSALCAVLFAALVGMCGALDGGGGPFLVDVYGAVLLRRSMGGYVLVGVVSFSAAVLLTVACIRYRERAKRDRQGRIPDGDPGEEKEKKTPDGRQRG